MSLRHLAAVLAVLAIPIPAHADTRLDIIDHYFGASNVNLVGGHGGLTIGVSADGDLTVLSWPGPSLRDHLAYFSSNAIDARALPRYGAHDGMGSYLGLLVTTAGVTELTWLRDAPWTSTQAYAGPLAPVPVTTFTRADLGLTVTSTDIVSPEVDVLTRHLRVERDARSPVTGVSLVVFENLAPSASRIPQIPIGDWATDTVNDFVAVWDDEAEAILHFHPGDRKMLQSFFELIDLDADVDYGAAEPLMQSAAPADADVAAFVDQLDATWSPVVTALVTTEPAPASFQVGSDVTPLCELVDELMDRLLALPAVYPDAEIPLDEATANALRCDDPLPRVRAEHGWLHQPQDARADLADGALGGSRIAAARTNGALITPLAFDGDVAEGSAMFAFGATRAAARAALDGARATSAAERLDAAVGAADEALGGLALPDPALGERVVDVARRALVNTYVARDRRVGAIVASISRQPPYFLDWPRDGAFFDVGLDVAGRHDWVSQRLSWYATVQRREFTMGLPILTPFVPIDPDSGQELFPRYVWEMNYYSDGEPGGPIRFEIDNTALHVWSIAAHVAHLDPAARDALLDDIWPTTRDAVGVLARWKEPDTGLPAPANEDDHLELTSTLHGAATVYAALRAGARLAAIRGEDALGRAWLARADELGEAILEQYWDPEAGLFRRERDGEGAALGGSSAWMMWPGRLLDRDDPRQEAQLVADMERVLSILDGSCDCDGGSYMAKNVLSAALYGHEDGARAMAREAVVLLADVATADSHHFGEVYLREDDGTWSNRVAQPHVWEGMLFYLAAMALTDPAPFDADLAELPLPSRGGCGCRSGAGRSPAWLMGLAALYLVLRRRATGTAATVESARSRRRR